MQEKSNLHSRNAFRDGNRNVITVMTWTTFCYTNRFAECNVKQCVKMLRFKMLKIIFGTESGNAEMAAEDMATVLTEAGIEAKAVAMDDYDVNGLTDEEHVILMTSTYG
ncbi:TPA: flavodoxin domain-containing protein, partial [Klebsiella pneumoniae]